MGHIFTFLFSLAFLIGGYYFYGAFAERVFAIDESAKLPAERLYDGVDYLVLPEWKIFMIQLLNIAGLGPIFGALQGAMFGPVAFLWIAFGCVFIGAVHDYLSGMLSVRHDGKSMTEIIGIYLGQTVKKMSIVFIIILAILVGVVFVKGPAALLANLTGVNITLWFYLIFAYYIAATMFPIDQIIGRIYPLFAVALIVMAVGIGGYMIVHGSPIPEAVPSNLFNMHIKADSIFIFPMLFITVACGAVSGFHATQSPMMARCMINERQGRRIFYGSMVAEGVIALIWAAAGMAFFGGVSQLNTEMAAHKMDPAWLVNLICHTWLGTVGGALAILGVVACPITTGDTAFRCARLIFSDLFNYDQKPIFNRLVICVPMFVTAFIITKVNFDIIWRYFAWLNQTLSVLILWTVAYYMMRERKLHWIATVPAMIMTAICTAYIMIVPEGFSLPQNVSLSAGVVCAFGALFLFTKLSSSPAKKIAEAAINS